jgi:hypothetical protein
VVSTPAIASRAPNRAGGQGAAFADATTAQRYEVKFWATEEQALQMLRVCEDHLEVDPFCRSGPQRNTSLYLDSPDRTFFDLHLTGVPDRFKLRVRTYDDPTGPAFLEVKRRVKTVVSKMRAVVPRPIAREIVAGNLDAAAAVKPTRDLMEFLYMYQRYNVEPALLVAARRLALRSKGDGGRFRLTLDRDIAYQDHCGNDLSGRPRGWIPVDTVIRNRSQAYRVLIETKFVDGAPAWLAPTVERLGLELTSYSKYVAATSQWIANNEAIGINAREDEDGE